MPSAPVSDDPTGSVSYWVSFQGELITVLPVLICTETAEDFRRIDTDIEKLLSEYGFSSANLIFTDEFPGSWFKLRIHRKSKDVETEFEFVLGAEASSSSKEPQKESKIKKKLEEIFAGAYGWLIVGTVFVSSIGAGVDLVKKYHEVFPSAKPPITAPAPDAANKIIISKLPPAITSAILNAKSDPEKLKFLIGFSLSDQLQNPDALLDRKQVVPPPQRPSDPGNL